MKTAPIVLIAFQEQDNLGVGYLASILLQRGHDVRLLDFRLGPEEIARLVTSMDPLVVGFSIIFQYHLHEFKALIRHLRACGIRCHFCAGGHYPSLRYRELMELIGELDSVVLFEGEHTFVELVEALADGRDWRGIRGLAHRGEHGPEANPLRPLEPDLDRFPPPVRMAPREYIPGRSYATILAGRGCLYNCSFCSIRTFYSQPPGPLKRLRRPEMVVQEMQLLLEQRGCSVFMFQDDDFPAGSPRERGWVDRFCQELETRGLAHQVLWKINCRPDEVDDAVFRRMKEAGLFLVYLGIESGTDHSLRLMNKRLTAAACLEAVARLVGLGIAYDFGFMLFDPHSTLDSVEANLDFLERLCGDGSSSITYCKMLPYAGTRIEDELRREGRLLGDPASADYRFDDPRVDALCGWFARVFWEWIGSHEGILNLSRWARYHTTVLDRDSGTMDEERALGERCTDLVSVSNRFFLDVARRMTALARSAGGGVSLVPAVCEFADEVADFHACHVGAFQELMERARDLAARKPGDTGRFSCTA